MPPNFLQNLFREMLFKFHSFFQKLKNVKAMNLRYKNSYGKITPMTSEINFHYQKNIILNSRKWGFPP